jgi:thiol-disulfide isomerase/thioredoxin
MDIAVPISVARRQQAFHQSISFDQFVASAQNFTDEFRANYLATALDDHDRAALSQIEDHVEVLAIVEDWCPDVVANLPILARIAQDTGKIRLHVLVRDDRTRDVADAYPFEGRSHIPTYVFIDPAGVELGVIVERTAPIQEHVEALLASFFTAHADVDRATFPAGISDDVKAELLEASLRLRRELRDLERTSFIDAITAIAAGVNAAPLSRPTTVSA